MKANNLAAPDLERAVLGSVLSDPVVLESLKPILGPEDFADTRHQHVYRAMLELAAARSPVDHLTVSERLRSKGVLNSIGGPGFLMELDQGIPLATRAPEYALDVRALSLRRKAIQAAQEVSQRAGDLGLDIDTVLSEGARSWASLTSLERGPRPGGEYLLEVLEELDRVYQGKAVRCIPSGIDRWDAIVGGLQPGTMTFVGARPGVGKTALMCTMMENMAKAGNTPGLFSLEDKATAFARRFLAKYSAVSGHQLAKGNFFSHQQKERIGEAAEAVHKLMQGMVIDDRSMLKPSQLVQSARHMILNQGVKAIFIDHLGKLDFDSGRHHRDDLAVEHGLNELTALAKDYNIPIIIAAHLTRGDSKKEEGAEFQRPTLSDFARTAYIGRDARVAVGLYLEKDDKQVLNVTVMKQTEGEANLDFQLRRLNGSITVASINGPIEANNDVEIEGRMLRDRYA